MLISAAVTGSKSENYVLFCYRLSTTSWAIASDCILPRQLSSHLLFCQRTEGFLLHVAPAAAELSNAVSSATSHRDIVKLEKCTTIVHQRWRSCPAVHPEASLPDHIKPAGRITNQECLWHRARQYSRPGEIAH